MANTDKCGYVKFDNDLYDAVLRQPLRITQLKAVMYIIRKTVGFNKIEDRISISKMADEVGCTRRAMINAVHDLQKMGIVEMGKTSPGRITSMRISDPSKWDRDP